MSYVILHVNSLDLEKAKKEYMKLIWQDNEPAGFEIKFKNTSTNEIIYGHTTRLDQDQCDFLGLLPKYINYYILDISTKDEDVLSILIQKLAGMNYNLIEH